MPDSPLFTRIDVNDEYCRVFGVQRKDVIDFSCLTYKREAERSRIAKKLDKTIATRASMLSTEINYLPNGGHIKVRWLDVPVMDCSGSGQVVEIIAIGEVIKEN